MANGKTLCAFFQSPSPIPNKREEKPRVVNQFQFHKWNKLDSTPSSKVGLISLIEQVERWQQKTGDGSMIVHCQWVPLKLFPLICVAMTWYFLFLDATKFDWIYLTETCLSCCSNGLIGSGLYTAVNCIWEKMKVDQEVDIFHAIKHLRYHRKNIVQDLVSNIFEVRAFFIG